MDTFLYKIGTRPGCEWLSITHSLPGRAVFQENPKTKKQMPPRGEIRYGTRSRIVPRPRASARGTLRARIVAAGRVPARSAGALRTAGYYGRFGPQTSGAQEMKFFDLDIDDATVAANGTIAQVSCNLIQGGSGEQNRVGRKCIIRSINWRYELTIPAVDNDTTPGTGDVVRVILYLDKQCNGATAATTDILESDDFQSFNNLANKDRFVVLLDRLHVINRMAGGGNGTNSDWPQQLEDSTFFKKCMIPIEFDVAAAAIGNVRSNNIGLLLVGRGGTATFASKMRLRFTDS